MCDITNTDDSNALYVKVLKLERDYLNLKRQLLASENNCLRQKLRLNTRERRQLKQGIKAINADIRNVTQPSLFDGEPPF